jgi:P27 family predicted phage terminase small subunit
MRGRKPLATATKEASGAFRKNPQRRNASEPTVQRGWPAKPETVETDDIASAQWDELCGTLDDMGILTVSDKSLLAMYCQTYAEYIRLHRHIRENGCVLVNVQGNETTSPQASQVHKYADRLIKLMAEMGLTPSSRSRIVAPKKDDDDDPMAELLTRLGGRGNN